MRFSNVASRVIILIAAVVASLIPANIQIRTGLHSHVEHFLFYFIATAIFCVAWPRPFIVAGVMMAFSALLEALQGLTPDRTPDLPTALSAAAGALTAEVLAKLVLLARKLALARTEQMSMYPRADGGERVAGAQFRSGIGGVS